MGSPTQGVSLVKILPGWKVWKQSFGKVNSDTSSDNLTSDLGFIEDPNESGNVNELVMLAIFVIL